jgi:hypothetical protein
VAVVTWQWEERIGETSAVILSGGKLGIGFFGAKFFFFFFFFFFVVVVDRLESWELGGDNGEGGSDAGLCAGWVAVAVGVAVVTWQWQESNERVSAVILSGEKLKIGGF